MSLKKKQNKKPPQNIGSLCNLKNESLKEERSQGESCSEDAAQQRSILQSVFDIFLLDLQEHLQKQTL